MKNITCDWPEAVYYAAGKIWGRLNYYKDDYVKWEDVESIDTIDHYCIAAQLAIKEATKVITKVDYKFKDYK